MVGSRIPGPICGFSANEDINEDINDGTSALYASPLPGPVRVGRPASPARAWRLEEWIDSHTASLRSLLEKSPGDSRDQELIRAYQRLIQSERSQLALQALGRINEIRRDVWVKLSRDQRADALREVHRAYLSAYGMGPATLRFELIPQGSNTPTLGQYDANTGVLTVDDRLLVPDISKPEAAVVFLVNTVVHESRHYLQWRVARHPKSFPSFYQAIEWHQAYHSPVSPTNDYKAYRANAVESDAFVSGDEAAKYLYPDANSFEEPVGSRKSGNPALRRIGTPKL